MNVDIHGDFSGRHDSAALYPAMVGYLSAISLDRIAGWNKKPVLIVEGPDAPDPAAPRINWSHWVLYNLPPIAGNCLRAFLHRVLPQGTCKGE